MKHQTLCYSKKNLNMNKMVKTYYSVMNYIFNNSHIKVRIINRIATNTNNKRIFRKPYMNRFY